ncbi:radical SAM family heme chaperone HemW [soil metagenome]
MGPGLYLHIPFCQHHCGYCNFAVMTGADDAFRTRYIAALKMDLSAVAAGGPRAVAPPGADVAPEWPTFTSVFVGGGTPTLLAPSDLAGLLRHAREALPVADDAEVTSEANPDGLTADGLSALVDAGLTRLSIGAQSFAPGVLSFLDRRHDREAPLRAVAAARAAGVAQVSLDLIYGAPAETARDWAASLRTALAARPDHVSAYALTLEANTPYAARVRGGAQAAPDDDVAAERMAVAGEVLGAAGLERYETSNWARPGARCRHNLTYWDGGDYLGVGAGAHGHWQGRRWWSTRPPARYADAALAGGSTTAGSEILDDATRRVERLMLGLRLVGGVDRAAVDPVDETALRDLVSAGLLDEDPDRLVLTAAGRPLADGVTLRLLPG